jgi:hypothetical protein
MMVFAAALFGSAPPLHATDLRCPIVTVGRLAPDKSGDPPTAVPEAPTILALWSDLGDVTAVDSGGPLGCPVGYADVVASDPVSTWSGVWQQFQRGAILIGRGRSAGFEIVAVRGPGGWTVWWKGPPTEIFGRPVLMASELAPALPSWSSAPAAAWPHGGYVVTSAATNTVALFACPNLPCVSKDAKGGKLHWKRITPSIGGQARPFDAAGSLDAMALVTRGQDQRGARRNAQFATWLPCFTRLSLDGGDPGEDSIARPTLMMRKADACRLTGRIPRSDAVEFLAALTFPTDQLPGTKSDDWPCGRKGDLDVTLVQLLHLVFENRPAFDAATLDHLRDIMQPYGGTPRPGPYVTPDGTCLGFGVIETENHILLQESARYLINVLLNESTPTDTSANRDWLLRFMQQLVRRDMYEFNALPYTRYQLKALMLLHDYAPDGVVATAARGVLDWLYTKLALSSNLDRDQRPYRRRPEADRYASAEWWANAGTDAMTEAAQLVGSLSHVHRDVDLFVEPDGKAAFGDTFAYPELGAADEGFLAAFTDVHDTKFVVPPAVASWLERRFTDDDANRVTYVQGIHHASPMADDQALFRQVNSGVEIMSGNRNWTMVGGGTSVAPGDPGPPPEGAFTEIGYIAIGAVGGAAAGAAAGGLLLGPIGVGPGAIIGFIGGLFAGGLTPSEIALSRQHDKLWGDQGGVMRETILIPSAVGLDRAQTLRFGAPTVSAEGVDQLPRLCVAEGFMCGFDLQMPSHPFPDAADQAPCPIKAQLPPAFDAFLAIPDGDGNPSSGQLGCLVVKPADDMRGWSIWTFEHAMLALARNDPSGQQRVAMLWVQKDKNGQRQVRMQLNMPNDTHDWYNYHVYNTAVAVGPDDPPSGEIRYTNSGDVDDKKTWHTGDASFSLDGVKDMTWYLIASGCDPTYGFLGIRTGHACHADIFPRLSVSVDDPPKQPFSCAAHQFRDGSLVLEVGGRQFVLANESVRHVPLCPVGAVQRPLPSVRERFRLPGRGTVARLDVDGFRVGRRDLHRELPVRRSLVPAGRRTQQH